MAKQNVNPDALASKTFIVTMLGAVLYIAVVFIFVIAGNAKNTADDKAVNEAVELDHEAAEHAGQGH